MRGSRLLWLGCTVVLVACSDYPTVPKGSPGQSSGGSGVTPVQLVELQGVVEMIEYMEFGLRRSDSEIVPILYDPGALWYALGREVTLRGRFLDSGEFSVSVLIFDTGDELSRVRPEGMKPSSGPGPRR